MALVERTSASIRLRQATAWALGLLIFCVYVALPAADEQALGTGASGSDEAGEEPDRLEVLHVHPLDPYPGSSLFIRYAGLDADTPVKVLANKTELSVIARHPGELVARLPRDTDPGVVRLRIVGESKPDEGKASRSKPFHLRVKAASPRKIFSSLLGGIALVAFGIVLLSRGVRESTGLHVARAVRRAAGLRTVAYGLGAVTGVLVQSTTSAASVFAALSSTGVLPLGAAAIAFLGAQCGASLVPLLVTGLIEPREGLVAVAIGVLWLATAVDRRAAALGRLVLGCGFVAFGLQVIRPGLEPFVSDPMLLSLADTLSADTPLDVIACALIGSALVALLQGPAPLIVLILAIVQTTGHADLTTALALLAGTGLGAAVAALLTASAGSQARRLARLHLWLGTASTVLATATVGVWSHAAELLLDPVSSPSNAALGALNALGLPLAVAFGLSQVSSGVVLSALTPLLVRWRERAEPVPSTLTGGHALRSELSRVLGIHQEALDALSVLAQTGARSFGRRAEHALADAGAALEVLVEAQARRLDQDAVAGDALLGDAALACLQLQHAIESLLQRAERVTEARLAQPEQPAHPGSSLDDDQQVLRELHELVSEGVTATRESLAASEPPDLDDARAREIKINRLESQARRVLHEVDRTPQRIAQHLHVLQVIDAYEVVGNQVYRLTEAMGQRHGALST
ncbi:MAG: hypothetical protein ABW252_15885 [Polyangiales bacterium]